MRGNNKKKPHELCGFSIGGFPVAPKPLRVHIKKLAMILEYKKEDSC